MRVNIQSIEYHLPETVVSNEELGRENPGWDMEILEKRTGVSKRHIVGPEETALDLAFHASEKFFQKHNIAKEQIDGLIFCTESTDHILPPNSCILHNKLGLSEDVLAFDFTLACSGYVYGLALAQGLIFSKSARRVLLVNADTYSKFINSHDRSTRVLFGDGAAVSLISASDSAQGIVDIKCSTSGKDYDKFIIPAGGCRLPKSSDTSVPMQDKSGNIRTKENIHMDGLGILTFVNSKVPQQVTQILSRNGLSVNDIDLFIFHQASNMALDSIERILKIQPEKMFRNLKNLGNLVSASIPIALKDAMDQGRIKSGYKVVLSGFGVGLSWATAIVEF